jgi:acyl transferase domain-containing protein/NADPH:quinone reductase-like Zn-dependent oxidoreductase/NADP-dependent 3-hydroxy acid dehydrogenase YdfG
MTPRPLPLSGAKLALLAAQSRAAAPDGSMGLAEPIAIIGIGCRFPGNVASAPDFWNLVRSGTDAIREVPPERWDASAYYSTDPHEPGRMNSRWGGFLDAPDRFDPVFFGLSPREAASMDPQQRLLLEVSWEALWDAGCAPGRLAGSSTGVFVAVSSSDYARLLLDPAAVIGPHTAVGSEQSIAPGRVSFLLDLRGPSIALDTACSSSLVAVHLATQSLRSGECRMALAGGVTLKLTPEHYLSLSKLGMLSPDGRCRTFDARANGFVPGEGCGVIVLKRLSEALADGDRIYALIRGTAANQDGRTSVITAPNGRAQQDVIRAALANARVTGADVGYVETHGTGTVLGDPIEVDAIAEVLGAEGAPPCALGAVKSNIGHLEVTAGVAGLIKAALVLDREEIPPNLHFESLNPHISLDGTRLVVPTASMPWKRGGALRFAGVSSFGFSGTNGHVILEEAPLLPRRPSAAPSSSASILVISARTPEAFHQVIERHRDFLAGDGARQLALADICAAAAGRRDHYEERLAIVGASHEEMCERLTDALAERGGAGVSRGRAPVEPEPFAFVFSGQGSQWPTMGTALIAEEPVFKEAMEECDRLVRSLADWSLLDVLAAGDSASTLSATEHAQAAICAIEIALARLLASWGVVPSVVIGHSAGEIAAAHVAGALSLGEAMRLIVHRGRIMQAATGEGRMALVSLAAPDVIRDIAAQRDRVSVAAMNGPQSTVISGARDAIDGLAAGWRARGVDVRDMPVDYAFHSPQMDRLLPELTRAFGTVRTEAGTVPLISTLTGLETSPGELNAAHWVRAVRQPVLFRHAVESALARGVRGFVEIGPHPVLTWDMTQCASRVDKSIPVLPTLRRGRPERAALLATAGGLFAAGQALAWERICRGRGPVVPLPTYPYQRQRYWLEAAPTSTGQGATPRVAPAFVLTALDSPALRGRAWETVLDFETVPFLADHRIAGAVVFPLTGFIELAMSAAGQLELPRPVAIENLIVSEPLVLTADAPCRVQVVVDGDRLDMHSRAADGWRHHVTATLRGMATSGDAPVIPGAEGSWASHDGPAFYDGLRGRGLEYGPSFRGIRTLRTSGSCVVADVRLPPEPAGASRSWTFHPALLDACLQTILATAADDWSACMPIALDALTIVRPAGGEVRCTLRERAAAHGNTETRSADFVITTPDGERIAEGRGFHLKRVSPAARAGGLTFELQWVQDDDPGQQGAQRASPILLIADEGAEISAQLASQGVACELRAPESVDDAVLASHERLIVVAEAGSSDADQDPVAAQEAGCRRLLDLAQRIVRQGQMSGDREVWIVTRDAHRVVSDDRCAGFAHATMWGLTRTLALEHPMLRWIRVDIDASPASVSTLAGAILAGTIADEIAFRSGRRFVPRLEPVAGERSREPRRLIVTERGSIDNLGSRQVDARAAGPHEVTVAVEASALNFRDVMNVLGAYPGDPGPLGAECCGVVTSIGSAVTGFRPGDLVMGIGWGSLSDLVVMDERLLTPVPPGLTAEEAVTLPNVFATAYHCLVDVARLQAGERVLIHAAAGGVGLMAVQIARHLGAEVFGTAGSDEKRRVLRNAGVAHVFDSRSLSFAEEIHRVTDGAGVDVVLNSLAGDFIGATLRTVRHGGRFVEIGRTGIWSDADVSALGRGIHYTVVDLGRLIDHEPSRIAEHFERLQEWVRACVIRPLPHRVFQFEDARAAFRCMERGRHTGKVVLRHRAGRQVPSRGTWLLTGGHGALGLEMADWLAAQGAERLLLVGRHAPSAEALVRIEALRSRGVHVDTHRVDLTHPDAFDMLDRLLAGTGSPPAGIVHLAGIVDDGVMEQQNWSRFRTVFGPKVDGAWLVHRLAAKHRVSNVVLFSSVSALLGSPGQSGYGAANAFLDGLAAYRAARGERTVAIDWGAWAEGGMAARLDAAGTRRGLDVVLDMTAGECLAALPGILESGAHHAVVCAFDRGASGTPASARLRSLLAASAAPVPSSGGAPAPGKLAANLAGLPRTRARRMVVEHLRDETRVVLGLASSHFVDEQQPLMKMGLDSLMALEMRNRLASAFGRPLTATLLFDYPTIGALADFLVPAGEQDTDVPRDAMFDDVAALSDEEAERLLEEEIDAHLGAE